MRSSVGVNQGKGIGTCYCATKIVKTLECPVCGSVQSTLGRQDNNIVTKGDPAIKYTLGMCTCSYIDLWTLLLP